MFGLCRVVGVLKKGGGQIGFSAPTPSVSSRKPKGCWARELKSNLASALDQDTVCDLARLNSFAAFHPLTCLMKRFASGDE